MLSGCFNAYYSETYSARFLFSSTKFEDLSQISSQSSVDMQSSYLYSAQAAAFVLPLRGASMTLRAIAMTFVAFLLSCVAGAADKTVQRGDPEIIGTASRYLDAYQSLDLAMLETFYSDDADFNDPTSIEVRGIGGPFVWRGRANILEGMRSWLAGGVTSLKYEIDDVYEASGRVVFVGAINSFIAAPAGLVQFHYRIVTIVTIENGLVSEHRDYTDYAGATKVGVAQ